jgi:hypothetical protein
MKIVDRQMREDKDREVIIKTTRPTKPLSMKPSQIVIPEMRGGVGSVDIKS